VGPTYANLNALALETYRLNPKDAYSFLSAMFKLTSTTRNLRYVPESLCPAIDVALATKYARDGSGVGRTAPAQSSRS
jgi:hypothetical protein